MRSLIEYFLHNLGFSYNTSSDYSFSQNTCLITIFWSQLEFNLPEESLSLNASQEFLVSVRILLLHLTHKWSNPRKMTKFQHSKCCYSNPSLQNMPFYKLPSMDQKYGILKYHELNLRLAKYFRNFMPNVMRWYFQKQIL